LSQQCLCSSSYFFKGKEQSQSLVRYSLKPTRCLTLDGEMKGGVFGFYKLVVKKEQKEMKKGMEYD
jgi:hypothetical protein